MTEKRLIQYKVLCDDYEEVRRILFEIIETGEEIEGHHQIQEWVDNLYKENEQLKSEHKVLHTQYQDLKRFVTNNFDEYQTQEKLNRKITKLVEENEQLKQQIKIFEKFLEANDLDIDWVEFCGVDECAFENPDFSCQECIHLKGDVE